MAVLQFAQANDFTHDARVINFVPKPDEPKLKKDGTPKKICQNKQKGKKSEVYALQIEHAKQMAMYFRDNEMWMHYMIFVLSCNLGRRISDTLALKWSDIYNTKTGNFKNDVEILEKKTKKLVTLRFNNACREAVLLYIEKTGCDPSVENYGVEICMQLSGTHPGKVMSYSGYYKEVKKAAEKLKIDYNVATHSTRKMFGSVTMMLHPGESDCINVLQQMFNHSDTKITNRYIDITKKRIDGYLDDFGYFFSDYVIGDKEYKQNEEDLIMHIKFDDFRAIMSLTYETAIEHAGETDPAVHANLMSQLIAMAVQLKK